MVSRLPITTRPAHREIAVSYLARLAALHDMPTEELWRQVSRTRRLDGDLLAVVANQPRARLNRAIIELLDPQPDWLALRHEPQRGCRRCNARHPGGPVLQLLSHHDYVCTQHHIWIGPPDQADHPQPALDNLPEVVAAQHRHRRLLHHIGPAATFDAVLTGFLICAHRWNFTDTATDGDDGDACNRWRRRAELLIPPGTEDETFSASRLFAATYPEAIAIAELLGSLHWRSLAAGDPDDQARFAAAIGLRLGQRDYQPTILRDPISCWIEHDCWRPPSLPISNYRDLRTFGGPAGFRKPAKDADARRQTSALWFGRHRRGGDAILHHRTLTPVILRDWSTKMELFTSQVAQTATTSLASHRALNLPRPQTPKEHAEFARSRWFRPHPQPSTYLYTAAEPVPWPERDGPRPTHGARPAFPSERPRGRHGLYASNPLRG